MLPLLTQMPAVDVPLHLPARGLGVERVPAHQRDEAAAMREDLFLRIPRLALIRLTDQLELGQRPIRPSFERPIVAFEVALGESIAERVGCSSPSGIAIVG